MAGRGKTTGRLTVRSAEEITRLIHELQLHEVELQMQNDELRKAQEDIQESRARYVDLYDFAPVGYLTIDSRSRIVSANLTAAAQLRVARRDLSRMIFTQFVAPGALDAYLRFKAVSIKAQEQSSCELELQRLDKTRFWASLESSAPIGGPNTVPMMRVALVDITERKAKERQVLEANARLLSEIGRRRDAEQESLRLGAAAEQAGEGILILDTDWSIRYANPAFERQTQLPRKSLLGRNYFDFLRSAGGGRLSRADLPDLRARGEPWKIRVSRRAPDAPERELDVTLSPVRDATGTLLNYIAIERDVTEQQRREATIHRLEKLEALGTMAGGIAHDLNNILTPVIINMELAQLELPEDNPLKSYVDTALHAAQRGKELVAQIITFSRQKEPARESLRVGPIITEILGLLTPSLPKNVAVRQNIKRGHDAVLADPGQLHQLIMNIFNNALTAMRESGGVLEVGLAPVEIEERQVLDFPDLKPGPYLRLTVKDTGTGMTPRVLEKAFDPFFTTKKPGDGAGMGLAVVASIVKSLRGTVTVKSERGKGSVFLVYLPRAAGAAARRRKGGKTIAGGTERVLIVEDDKVQVETLKKALEKLGYAVKAMDNSAGALAVFREGPADFDVVVTDQSMPGLTGIRLAEEILKVRPDIPVILCTGFSEEADPERTRAAGIARFMMKPFTIRDMAAAIRQVLQRRRKVRPVNRSG